MKISANSIVITPPLGLPLAGNGRADSAARGIHDDLRANMIYLASGDEAMLFIGMDLLALPAEPCDRIRRGIAAATGLGYDRITITCTHTHSGPNTMEIFAYFLTEQDKVNCKAYVAWLEQAVIDAGVQTVNSAAPGLMGYGHDIVEGFSFCRRVVLKDGSLKMIFEDYDTNEVDHLTGPNGNPIMSVFAFTDPGYRVKALLVHYTSHPAVVCGEDWLYTRDYIHALTESLQKRFGKDVVVLYANGAQGNQVAADPYHPFITGWEEADRVGRGMAEGAKRIVSRILMEKKLLSEVSIQAAVAEAVLPVRKIEPEELARVQALMDHAPEEVLLHGLDPRVEASSILEMARYPLEEEAVPIQAIRLGEQIIVTFPGEVFLEFGHQVMYSTQRDLMIFGLANGYVGYIPTEEAFSQGGYEIKTSRCSSRFAPKAGQILADACIRLTKEIL